MPSDWALQSRFEFYGISFSRPRENRSIVKFESCVGGREVTCGRHIPTRARKHRQTVGAVHTKNKCRRGERWVGRRLPFPCPGRSFARRAPSYATRAFIRKHQEERKRKKEGKERGKNDGRRENRMGRGEREIERERYDWINRWRATQRGDKEVGSRNHVWDSLDLETPRSSLRRAAQVVPTNVASSSSTGQKSKVKVPDSSSTLRRSPFHLQLRNRLPCGKAGCLRSRRSSKMNSTVRDALYHVKTQFPNYDHIREECSSPHISKMQYAKYSQLWLKRSLLFTEYSYLHNNSYLHCLLYIFM